MAQLPHPLGVELPAGARGVEAPLQGGLPARSQGEWVAVRAVQGKATCLLAHSGESGTQNEMLSEHFLKKRAHRRSGEPLQSS